MNKLRLIGLLMVGVLLVAACSGGTAETSEDGFDFTEDDAAAQDDSEGMEFSEEEVSEPGGEEGMVFSEDEVSPQESEPGFDFTEEEDDSEADDEIPDEDPEDNPAEDPDVPDTVFPPEGTSNWMINHDEGTITCPNISMPFEASPPEPVTITLGAEAASLIVQGMGEAPEIFFFLLNSGPGGSFYDGYYTPPGSGVEIHYEIVFTNISDPATADYLMGNITSEEQGCKVSRSFGGERVD